METATAAPKLVISFSGLLARIAHGDVSLDEVRDGLFYFGCARRRVFEYDETGGTEVRNAFRQDEDAGRLILGELQEILLQAEAEGRAVWRESRDHNTYEQLNALLEANGVAPLPIESLDWSQRYHYNYPTVRELAQAAGIQIFGY